MGRTVRDLKMAVRDEAYGRAATIPNAVSRFRESGIHPFDRGEFRGQLGAAAVNDIAVHPWQFQQFSPFC